MGKDNLTEHFSDHEFRCKCGCGGVVVDTTLLESLEVLRAIAGRPVYILSGCRCRSHNESIGGAKLSQHLIEDADGEMIACKAADVYISGMRPRQIFRSSMLVPKFREGGIGVYEGQGFVHVDVRGHRARWFYADKASTATSIPRNYY